MQLYFNQIPEICDGCNTPHSKQFVCSPMYLDKSICPCSSCILKVNCTKVCTEMGEKILPLRKHFDKIDINYRAEGFYAGFLLIIDFAQDPHEYSLSDTYVTIYNNKWITFIRSVEKPNFTIYLYGFDGMKPGGVI